MDGIERAAADFAAIVPEGTQPLLTLRRRGCGCRLGSVFPSPHGFVLAGFRRTIVESESNHTSARRVPFLQLLDHPDRPEDMGCRHSAGSLLPLEAIAAAAREVRRRGEAFWVD